VARELGALLDKEFYVQDLPKLPPSNYTYTQQHTSLYCAIIIPGRISIRPITWGKICARRESRSYAALNIHAQQRHDKNQVYSVHEPEVECIAKGKTGKKSKFGNKVSVAVISLGGWMVGAKSYTGNPYDSHTLAAQLQQVNNLIGDRVSEAYVDMGYRGHDYEGAVTVRADKRQRGRPPRPLWRWMKRRKAVEPSEDETPAGAQPAGGQVISTEE
jgi:IS5 family transposase